jgi:hypothetical protein
MRQHAAANAVRKLSLTVSSQLGHYEMCPLAIATACVSMLQLTL